MTWFSDLSKAQQAEYIKKHPNSKYAKSKKASTKTTTKAAATKIAAAPKTSQALNGNGRQAYIALHQDLAFETNPARKAQLKKEIEAHRKKYNLD